jgi:hypothetical protein
MSLDIIPTPQKISIERGKYRLPDDLAIRFSILEESKIEFYRELIAGSLALHEKRCSISENDTGAKVELQIVNSEEFPGSETIPGDLLDQGYYMEIARSGITLTAVSDRGILYGILTLVQLIDNSPDGELQCAKILDYPDLKIRGISDDISRGQVSKIDNFKRIIAHIARYKMNTYMPYIEDVLEFEAFPTIGKNRGALSREEIKELLEFAELYNIEVIPVFQTLGHYENILSQSEFVDYAEFPGAASLDVSNEKTYEFLEILLEEVFEMFPSKYFHMGADESWDVGLGKSKDLVEATDLATVHLNHYKRIHEICKENGKEVLMYGDIILRHPEILDGLPEDITIVDWHYRPDFEYPSTSLLNEAGFKYFVSPSVWNFLTTFPTNINAVPNIKYITESGLKNNASGMINSNWGDYGAETIKELILFGYAWSADCSWNYNAASEAKFMRSYFKDFFRVDQGMPENLYLILSHPFNQMMWHEVWRHPLLKLREPVWWEPRTSPAARISHMNSTLPVLKKEIAEFRKTVRRNKDHLDILEFLYELNTWFALKIQTQVKLHDLMQERHETDGEEFEIGTGLKDSLARMIDLNIEDLQTLKNRYRDLWLKYYKSDNLNMIDDKFERLIAYFNETKALIYRDDLKSPEIPSQWIYYPNEKSVKKAKFRKNLNLDTIPESPLLQMLGDTYAKLYINGQFAGEVYARRSLSLLVDYRRILFSDIKEYLKEGDNNFEIVVENYNKKGRAGFNLITNITENGEVFMSDETWEVTDLEQTKETWRKSEASDYRYEVIAPNFDTGRSSWIER